MNGASRIEIEAMVLSTALVVMPLLVGPSGWCAIWCGGPAVGDGSRKFRFWR